MNLTDLLSTQRITTIVRGTDPPAALRTRIAPFRAAREGEPAAVMSGAEPRLGHGERWWAPGARRLIVIPRKHADYWGTAMTPHNTPHQRPPAVVIIGAGFGGLGMALELRRAGFTNFTILEKASDLGGVWRENTYPGAGCDIPSPYYSFSHQPNPAWPRRFSHRADIHAYMRRVAAHHGLYHHIRFGTEVTAATFEEATGRWRVETSTGVEVTADLLVPAVGQLSRPAMPTIPGLDSFRGTAFHSARWDHEQDLTGKRVAVVGTGASAIQFVPEIQPNVARLTVFQRSAPWVLPKPDVRYKPWHHTMFRRLPITRLAERFAVWGLCEVLALGLVDLPPIRPAVAWIATRHLNKQVSDPALRAKLTPNYAPGCKRGLFSNDYYPALAHAAVDLVTERISEIVPEGVRTSDGAVHEVDTIIYGTGFKAAEFLAPISVRGIDGRRLADVWGEGASAYLGMAVPGFPNMFIMYGPNTNLGVGSIIHMLESQARYITQIVRSLARRPGRAFEVTTGSAERYDTALQRRLGRSVWTGCSSWYRDATGRITGNWPGTVSQYRRRTRRVNFADYRSVPTSGTPRLPIAPR